MEVKDHTEGRPRSNISAIWSDKGHSRRMRDALRTIENIRQGGKLRMLPVPEIYGGILPAQATEKQN